MIQNLRPLPTVALLVAVLAACAPGTTPGPDAGTPEVDAGPGLPPVEPTVAGPCDEDRIQEVTLNGNRGSFEVDTSAREVRDLRPLDIGFECGNTDSAEWAPQVVARLTVPGTGQRALSIDTDNTGTDDGFVTVIQVRRACGEIPTGVIPTSCGGPTNTALHGQVVTAVQGGETVYLVITGYAGIDGQQLDDGTEIFSYGVARVDLELFDSEAPQLDSAQAVLVGSSFEVSAEGSDADGDVVGLVAQLFDAEGATIDLNGDGFGNSADQLARTFSPRPTTEAFKGTVRVDGARAFFEAAGAKTVKLRAFDQGMAVGNELTLTIGELAQVGIDATCDATHRCAPGLTCTAEKCVAPAAAVTACAGAVAVDVVPPNDTTAAAKLVTGQVLLAGTGALEASCAPTPGKEVVYAVPVPATGKWDLVATTAVTGVAANVDTVLSIRSQCADATTELACNDEVAQRDSRSVVGAEVSGGGTAYVVADYYNGIQTGQQRYSIQFTLRPVLPTGATCDKDQRLNRCDRAYCNVDTLKCP